MTSSPEMPTPATSEDADTGPRLSPARRAFVVQFDALSSERGRLRGRVEAVASGEATRFRSLKQLVGFMAGNVRKQASSGRRSEA